MTDCHRSFGASDSIGGDAWKPQLRSLPDRLCQIALYEIGGLGLISPLFALAVGISPINSLGLLAVLALIMGAWNGVYSTACEPNRSPTHSMLRTNRSFSSLQQIGWVLQPLRHASVTLAAISRCRISREFA